MNQSDHSGGQDETRGDCVVFCNVLNEYYHGDNRLS